MTNSESRQDEIAAITARIAQLEEAQAIRERIAQLEAPRVTVKVTTRVRFGLARRTR